MSVGPQDQVQGLEAVADADAMLHSAVCGKLAFEGLDFLAEDVPARIP